MQGLTRNPLAHPGPLRVSAASVGRAFIANPDLVRRLQLDAPLNPADETSFYGGTDAGYIAHPSSTRPRDVAPRSALAGRAVRPLRAPRSSHAVTHAG
jgi:hypothetical protein